MSLKIMTANRLRDGEVVYLTARGTWSEWLHEADVASDPDQEERFVTLAEGHVRDLLIVAPYVMSVAVEAGRLQPLGQREAIRARGPSTRLDLGKQARQPADVSL